MTVFEVYEAFLMDCKIRKLTDKTIIDYQGFLKPFLGFVGGELPLDNLTLSLVQKYVYFQASRPLSIATYATYIRHLKAFLNYACREQGLALDTRRVKVPREPKKVVDLYSPSDIRLLFSAVEDVESDWLVARNRAMIALMLDSGLRRSEVVSLSWDNVYISDRYVKVLGKGRKERIVPLGLLSSRFIQEYASLCPFAGLPSVFVGRRGEVVTADALKNLVHKLNKRLPFHLTCHLLRHNFATNWCLDQYEKYGHMDPHALMSLLGHSSMNTTMRYLHHAQSLVAARNSESHLDKIFLPG